MSVPEANAPSQSWTTLLQNYISKGKQKPMKEQEEETTQLFMDILDEDAKKNEEENSEIPRFFF